MYTNRNGASTNPNADSSLLYETFYPARGAHFTNTDTCQCKHNTCTRTSTVAPCSSLEVSPWVQTTHHNTILVAPPAEMELVTPRYPRNSRNEKSQQISSLSIWARVPEIPAGSNHWWAFASNASLYQFNGFTFRNDLESIQQIQQLRTAQNMFKETAMRPNETEWDQGGTSLRCSWSPGKCLTPSAANPTAPAIGQTLLGFCKSDHMDICIHLYIINTCIMYTLIWIWIFIVFITIIIIINIYIYIYNHICMCVYMSAWRYMCIDYVPSRSTISLAKELWHFISKDPSEYPNSPSPKLPHWGLKL